MLREIYLTDREMHLVKWALAEVIAFDIETLQLCRDSSSKRVMQDSVDELKILRSKFEVD